MEQSRRATTKQNGKKSILERLAFAGIGLFQRLTGQLPFVHSIPAAALIAHISQPPPHPREIEPDIPLPAAEAILKALEIAPGDRFDSAGDFAKAIHG